MNTKVIKKLTALFAVCALTFGSVVPAYASNYTPINGTTTDLEKVLIVDSDTEIPEAEFEFTVTAPATGIEATANTVKVWPGVDPELVEVNGTAEVGTVSFTAGEAKTAGAANDTYANDANKSYATKTIELDFSNIEYTEPGVYRYYVTETDPTSPISAIGSTVTTVDLYVEDVDGDLEVLGYVAYEGTITAAPSVAAGETTYEEDAEGTYFFDNDTEEYTTTEPANPLVNSETGDPVMFKAIEPTLIPTLDGKNPNGAEAGTKDDKFRNELTSNKLKFGKEVTGNQGSKDQYFEFTVTLSGLGEGTVLTVNITDNDIKAPHENNATSYDVEDMTDANNRDDDSDKTGQQLIANASGEIEWVLYLHDGQYVEIVGIPTGSTYSVAEENAAGYTKIEGITAEVNGSEAYIDPVSGTIGSKMEDVEAGYFYDGVRYDTLTAANAAAVDDGQEMPAEGEPATGVEYRAASQVLAADQNVKTGWTNDREGVLPTGIIVAAGLGIALAGVGVVGYVATRKKNRED